MVLQRGNYGHFLDLAVLFSRLRKSAASGGLRRFSEKPPPLPLPLSCLSAAMSMRQIGRRGGGGGGGALFGHKTLYYGYQGDGYGPLRGHNTMLLPREILHLGPSGHPGALVGSIGLLFNAPIQGNDFAVRGREGHPRTPSRIFIENTKSGYFLILRELFWGGARGKLRPFFGFGGFLL